MVTVATLYNTLPTLEDAEKRFVEREKLFAAVGQLLAEYGNVFGLCLVHAHCILTDDEIMLARGNVSQPEKATSLVEYYPERWLCSGEAGLSATSQPHRDGLESVQRRSCHHVMHDRV
ncbi:hypothetical protein HCEG_06876 [Histoplasma capsulatum var. duboisii H88]|uniref:Uncharacterized protein n=1 Tax=Ajellomyces capsulatus (strain H88) TaxID=544711 RepID=F0UNV7_AJEC8|nr:hypothetical protein HCEG_06876 [Histoplasma capsulatum var. duboisii H88]